MSYRLGIIGAGGIARVHAEAASGIGVTIAGFCDVIQEKAEEAAQQYAGAIATTEIDELLDDEAIDAVVVAVPNRLHAPCAIRALEAGKDVLLEKPMAMSITECDAIIDAMEQAERLVQLSFVCRWATATVALKRFIDSGRLGRIYHARATWIRRRGIPGLGRWFTTKSESGGGVLIDLGVHMIDLVMHLTGRPAPRRVSGSCTCIFGAPPEAYRYVDMWAGPPNTDGIFDVEDGAHALIRFDGGLTMELSTTWAANIPEEMMPSGVTLMGEKGGCFYDIWGDTFILATEQDGHIVDVKPHMPPGEKWAQGWKRQHERFAECVTKRLKPTASAAHGREVQRVLEAIYRSSDEGREVEVGE